MNNYNYRAFHLNSDEEYILSKTLFLYYFSLEY